MGSLNKDNVKKGGLISLVLGILFILIALIIAYHFPSLNLSDWERRIIGLIVALPWVSFLIFICLSFRYDD